MFCEGRWQDNGNGTDMGGGGGTNYTLVIEKVQLNCCCSFCVADACLSAGPDGAAADFLIADLLLLMLLLLWMFLVLLLVVILLVLSLVLLLLVAGAVAGAAVTGCRCLVSSFGIFASTECRFGTPLTPHPVHMAHTCQTNGRHKTPLT